MIQGLMAEVVADFRRSGDALYMQYRFADALASYEKALMEIAREDAPALWAGTMVNIGVAHMELGIRVQAFEAKEHLGPWGAMERNPELWIMFLMSSSS